MKEVLIVLCPGISTHKEGWSSKTQELLTQSLFQFNISPSYLEIVWSDLTEKEEMEGYSNTKNFFFSVLRNIRKLEFNLAGDLIQYQPQIGSNNFYIKVTERIDHLLKEKLRKIDKSIPIVFLGHSLGTVILYNFLLDLVPENKTIGQSIVRISSETSIRIRRSKNILVTLGSPIELYQLSIPSIFPCVDYWFNLWNEFDLVSFPIVKTWLKLENNMLVFGHLLVRYTPLIHTRYLTSKKVAEKIAEKIDGKI